MAMRVSCQIGKFHGMIARLGPRGRKETYALTVPVGAGSSAIIFGPCSAYQSASCALFSISASASEKIFPIFVEMTFASCALFFLTLFPSGVKRRARFGRESLRND